MSIAAALATKAVSSLYDMVKKRFEHRAEARAALEAATAAPEKDQAEQHADRGGTTNQVIGDVSGKVLQARDIHGDVSF